MTLAIFDLDNTLIAGDSDHQWGEFLVHKALVDAEVYKQRNDEFFRAYQDGSLDIQEYLNFALAPFARLSDEQIKALQQEFLAEWIEPLMLEKAQDLIQKHRELGHQLLIITATNNIVTSPIAERLGVPHLLASEAERGASGYTGRPTGTPCFQGGKVTRLNEWLRQYPHQLERAHFYSDSANDLPLLETVGYPTAVDRTPDSPGRHRSGTGPSSACGGDSVIRLSTITALLLASALGGLSGCDSGPTHTEKDADASSATPSTPPPPTDPALASATLDAWALGERWLTDARQACAELHSGIEALLAAPSDETLDTAKAAWRRCHNRWHTMNLWLALGESNPGLYGDLSHTARNIDAQPIQPGYLDAIEGYPFSGIVNDITLDISATTLHEQHGLTDESDVVLGLHALEFLLWGEHGARPSANFEHQSEPRNEQLSAELTESQLPNNRRRELLRLTSQLLLDDLDQTLERWSSSDSRWFRTYRQLHPSSRLALLREATRHLLQHQLPSVIDTQGDPEEAHNRFAGGTQALVVSSLRGLEALATTGEPPLSTQLPSGQPTADAQEEGRWQQAWRPIATWLENPDQGDLEALSRALNGLGEVMSLEGLPEPSSGDAPATSS